MKAHQLSVGERLTLSLRLKGGAQVPFDVREEVEVSLKSIQGAPTLICAPDPNDPQGDVRAFDVEGISAQDKQALLELTTSGRPVVFSVVQRPQRGTELILDSRRFVREFEILNPVDVGIDDKVVADINATFRTNGTVDFLASWLLDRLALPPALNARPGAPPRFIVSENSAKDVTPDAFRVFGDECVADVRRKGDKLLIERVARSQRGGKKSRLELLNAHFRFVDATAAAVVHGEARAALSEIVGKDNSYLRVWSEYHERESQVILGQAMDFGALEYVSTHQRVEDDGWSFELVPSADLEQRLQALKDLGRVELVASEEAPDVNGEGVWQGVKVDQETLSAPVRGWRRREGLLDLAPPTAAEPQPPPPDVGYLSLSLSGDIMRLARRKQAEEALRSGQVEIPQLGLLMEGRPAPMSRRPAIHLDAPSLKRALREAFGGGRPTPRQLWAIEVALNTPDLCLIQGPPGTGKTKVITAIQHCLAALAEKGKEVSNQVLVTAAQHDAVENVAARSKIFGLPAMKVGRRRGAREEEGVSNITRLFSAERVEALRATLRVTPLTARLDEVRSAVINAQLSKGTPAEHAARLREVLRLLRTPEPLVDLSPGLAERIASCATELERAAIGGGDAEELARRVKSTRAVRVTPSTFADDGPLRARAALLGLDALLSPALRAFLERCAAVDLEEEQEEAARRGVAVEEALVWVQEGASLRDALLDELTQPPAQPVAPLNDETHEALKGLLGALVTLLKRSRLGELGVIADYIEALESDLPLLQSTLEEYTFTLAATLQQAAGRAMRDAVGVETGTPFFDSVIVDEAARAHPLDLFIPLSMAKRRVALVGDHRQLPHLLEPDVERLLVREVEEGSVSEETLKAVRASLFSRLWGILKDLERADSIERVVTLNAQYRMHPVLGKFVSDEFYERHGDGAVESPRPASDFVHDLPGYLVDGVPAAAAWLDVPAALGGEVVGQSKRRPAEAVAIARELKRLIEHDARLTFGVICFYSAQVQEVLQALVEVGVAEEGDVEVQIKPEFLFTYNHEGEGVERLRVGTVDSFQGKEFDVVFLSVGRSNDLPARDDRDHRRKYGHLTLENRLCVAMSRQQRLLIAAGDLEFVSAPEAQEPLRALQQFTHLCQGAHGVIRSAEHTHY